MPLKQTLQGPSLGSWSLTSIPGDSYHWGSLENTDVDTEGWWTLNLFVIWGLWTHDKHIMRDTHSCEALPRLYCNHADVAQFLDDFMPVPTSGPLHLLFTSLETFPSNSSTGRILFILCHFFTKALPALTNYIQRPVKTSLHSLLNFITTMTVAGYLSLVIMF